MAGYKLSVCSGGVLAQQFRLPPEGVVIGRAPEVNIVLAGLSVSRRHARIWFDHDTLKVEDLGSRNGVFVNSKPIKRGPLEVGDRLAIGETTFEVLRDEDDLVRSRSAIAYDAGTKIFDKLVSESTGRFPILYRAAQLLGSVFEVDDLMTQILAVIFDALPARRGFVLTIVRPPAGAGPATALETIVRAKCAREGEDECPPVSRTLIEHVIARREAILTPDAQEDTRFDRATSIVQHGIRAAMCAPLCGRDSIEGAIYVDSGSTGGPFTEADLQLLTAIARIVGIAVQNARLYQERLDQERMAALGRAMAEVGHCMKNILTGIRGGGEFIDSAIAKSDFKYLERGWPIMRRAIERIDMLVLNLLTYAREREMRRAPTNLNPIIRQVLTLFEPRAKKLHVTIEFDPGLLGEAFLDGHAMQRVILNLVANALDACERTGGQITITTACDGLGHRIEIRDTGVGVPPEILPKLSQPFVTTKGSSGIGLGLACCYKIIRAHGGDIAIESEPGKGAKFTVLLPRETVQTLQG